TTGTAANALCQDSSGDMIQCTQGAGSNAVLTPVSFSATPTFTVTASSTPQIFSITLTGNVTSSTLTATSATAGQQIGFQILQDGTGGRTFVWPTNVHGACTISPTLNVLTTVLGVWDGTNITNPTCTTNDGWRGISETATVFSTLPSTAPTGSIAWVCDNIVTTLGSNVTSGSGSCGTGSAIAQLLFSGSNWVLIGLGAPQSTVVTVTTLPAASA